MERFLWWIIRAVGVFEAAYGATYALGGTANTPALLIMQEIIPMRVWGLFLLLAGGALVGRFVRVGGAVGGAAFGMFAVTAIISVAQGTAASAGGPWLLALLATLHVLISYGAVYGLISATRG